MEIAQHAMEFYKKFVSPYQFVMGIVDQSDMVIERLAEDDQPASLLDVHNRYIFAYEIPNEAYVADFKSYL